MPSFIPLLSESSSLFSSSEPVHTGATADVLTTTHIPAPKHTGNIIGNSNINIVDADTKDLSSRSSPGSASIGTPNSVENDQEADTPSQITQSNTRRRAGSAGSKRLPIFAHLSEDENKATS